MYSTLKRRGNHRFHVVSTWNTRDVFVRIYLRISFFFAESFRTYQEEYFSLLIGFLKSKSFLKRYCAPDLACNFIFSTENTLIKYNFKKHPQVKITSSLKEASFCFFTVTIKIEENFLCNSLLHRNKRLLITGQVFPQPSGKLVQNEKDYS